MRVFLDNLGDKPVTVFRRTAHTDVSLSITDNAGGYPFPLPPPSPPPVPQKADLAVVAAGQSLELTNIELLSMYNHAIASGTGDSGTYLATMSYHAGVGVSASVRELDPAVWVGSLECEPLRIEITVP